MSRRFNGSPGIAKPSRNRGLIDERRRRGARNSRRLRTKRRQAGGLAEGEPDRGTPGRRCDRACVWRSSSPNARRARRSSLLAYREPQRGEFSIRRLRRADGARRRPCAADSSKGHARMGGARAGTARRRPGSRRRGHVAKGAGRVRAQKCCLRHSHRCALPARSARAANMRNARSCRRGAERGGCP